MSDMVKIAFNSALAQKALGKETPASETVKKRMLFAVLLQCCSVLVRLQERPSAADAHTEHALGLTSLD